MTKAAIQASNQAKREQIIHVGQNHKIEIKLYRKRMQKEEDNLEKQTKIIAVAVKKAIAWMLIWHLKGNHLSQKVVGSHLR